MLNDQGNSKISYQSIFHEPIHPSVPIKVYPYNIKMPKIDKFTRKEDPSEHLMRFKYSCYNFNHDNVLMLRFFPMMLGGQALNWYNNLPQHSILSFEQLANQFLNYFDINIKRISSITDLLNISQHDDDSIKYYMAIWREIGMDLPYPLPHDELINIFTNSCHK